MARTTSRAESPGPDGSTLPLGETPSGNGEARRETEIPSSEPGDLGDFERFAATDDFEAQDVQTLFCAVGRPGANDYIRAHPNKSWWRDLFFLESTGADGRRTLYLVDPSLRGLEELEGKVKRRRLVPYMTLAGGLGVWPIGIEFADNSWVASGLRACEQAVETWVMPVSMRAIGQYKIRPASGSHPDPKWPDLSLGQIIDLAFPEDKRILDTNHPVLAKLRGE